MSPPLDPPRPRRPIAVDRTVGKAVEQRRFDDPSRRTLTGLSPMVPEPFPRPAQLPAEHAATLPAPSTTAQTRRAPSPLDVPIVHMPQPPTPSVAPGIDELIGKTIRKTVIEPTRKYLSLAGVILSLGGGGVALKVASAKPDPGPITATAADLDRAMQRIEKLEAYAREQRRILDCTRSEQDRVNGQLLPAKDRTAAATKLTPWSDECPDLPKSP